MPNQQLISEQEELLAIYRRTLAHYIREKASLTGSPIPPVIGHGIQECREEIGRIKQILRNWGVQVDDYPDDDPRSTQSAASATQPKNQSSPRIPSVPAAHPSLAHPDPSATSAGESATDALDSSVDTIGPSWNHDFIRRIRQNRDLALLIALAIVLAAGVLIVFIWSAVTKDAAQDPVPHFDIAAINTLSSDMKAYEVTGVLPKAQSELDTAGISITFTLEVRPTSAVNQQFGRVVALISGSDGRTILTKLLWQNFSQDSSTQEITLTFPELLQATGLNGSPNHVFSTEDRPFQQAKLIIKIAREADLENPWQTEEITIRNEPWDLRSDVVERNGQYQADVYVKNLGGPGEFKITYRLAYLDKEINKNSQPIFSGATQKEFSVQPVTFKQLATNSVFTDTHTLPNDLEPGRYLLEVIPFKRQNYVQFKDDSINWENIHQHTEWWWFSGPYHRTLFLVHPKFDILPEIQAEVDRLKNDSNFDLGLPVKPASEVKSTKTTGLHQVFQKGEVYAHDSKAFALYGPILERYNELQGLQNDAFGFPTSPIQDMKSVSGAKGMMMSFEGSATIYATERGIAITQGLIGFFFSDQGGPEGRLGFPLTDEQSRNGGYLQMYENGYIVCCDPKSYPYVEPNSKLNSTLLDVSAKEPWQDTGIEVKQRDRITIVQTAGSWTNDELNQPAFDADGNQSIGNQEGGSSPVVLTGTLIGKIGNREDNKIYIGRTKSFLAPSEGRLFLGMEDSHHDDNGGVISVQIFIERSN